MPERCTSGLVGSNTLLYVCFVCVCTVHACMQVMLYISAVCMHFGCAYSTWQHYSQQHCVKARQGQGALNFSWHLYKTTFYKAHINFQVQIALSSSLDHLWKAQTVNFSTFLWLVICTQRIIILSTLMLRYNHSCTMTVTINNIDMTTNKLFI